MDVVDFVKKDIVIIWWKRYAVKNCTFNSALELALNKNMKISYSTTMRGLSNKLLTASFINYGERLTRLDCF